METRYLNIKMIQDYSKILNQHVKNVWDGTIVKESWNPQSDLFGLVLTFLCVLVITSIKIEFKSNTVQIIKCKMFLHSYIPKFLNFYKSISFFKWQAPISILETITVITLLILFAIFIFIKKKITKAFLFFTCTSKLYFAANLSYKLRFLNN